MTYNMSLACAVVSYLLSVAPCPAQTVLFRDDFDGMVSEELMVVNHEGERAVVDGWYQWTPTESSLMNSVLEGLPNDVSLRTRVRLLEQPAGDWVFIGVVGRDDLQNDGGRDYFAGIATDARIGIGISGGPILAEESTLLDPVMQDVEMQFDMLGNQLTFTAWEAGTPRPSEPTISITDDTHPVGGRVALSYNPRSSSGPTVAFDFFEVVHIPEPSAGVLILLGTTSMLLALPRITKARVPLACAARTPNLRFSGKRLGH